MVIRSRACLSLVLGLALITASFPVTLAQPSPSFPTSGTFTNHRGELYSASWNYDTYQLEISGKFPWNALIFVGGNGSIGIWDTGDVKSMRARDWTSLSHTAMIGLRNGTQGQLISYPQKWTMAPGWIGYSTSIMGLNASLKATFMGQYHSATGIVEMTLSNPSSTRKSVSVTYAQAMAIAWDYGASRVGLRYPYNYDAASYNSTLDAIVVHDTRFGWVGYLYSDLGIADWSASDCCKLDKYVTYATLDKNSTSGAVKSDANVAIRVSIDLSPLESKTFRFFTSLDKNSRGAELLTLYRNNFLSMLARLNAERLAGMKMLPVVRTTDPEMNMAYFIVNYATASLNLFTYPWLYGGEDAQDYPPDNLIFARSNARYLPQPFLEGLKKWLTLKSQHPYLPGERKIPYMLPDHVLRYPTENIANKFDFSDITGTAMWVMGTRSAYEASGDLVFLQEMQLILGKVLGAIESWDSDGDGFPNISQSMQDVRRVGGTFAFESALAGYAYRDGAFLLSVLGDQQKADYYNTLYRKLVDTFDTKFWDANLSFVTNYNATGSPVPDRLIQGMFIPQWGELGRSRLTSMLTVLEGPDFNDPVWGVRWLGVGDPHYTGRQMQGGFWVSTPLFVASGEFLADRFQQGTSYMQVSARQVARGGLFDETYVDPPSLDRSTFRGLNLFVEPSNYAMDSLVRALGLETNGATIFISPKWTFDPFEVDKLTVWDMGHYVTLKISKSSGAVSVTKTSDDAGYFSIVIGSSGGQVRQPSSTVVTLQPSTTIYGEPVLLTATINAQVNDGVVSFEQSSDAVTWQPIQGGSGAPVGGVFSFTWNPQLVGRVYVRASWGGNADYFGSASAVKLLTVNPSGTMVLDITLVHIGNSASLMIQGQAGYSNGIPYVGEVNFSHKDSSGAVLKSDLLITTLAGTFSSKPLIPVYGLNIFEARVEAFGGPITRSHLATLSSSLLSVQWSSLSLKTGDVLTITFTIQNIGDIALATQAPAPGFTYQTSENFQSKGFASLPATFRVGVDFTPKTISLTYPFRWGLGGELSPGSVVTITGNIKIGSTSKVCLQVFGGLIYEPSTFVADRVNPVTICLNQ